jgi:phosphoglycolate phosphatase
MNFAPPKAAIIDLDGTLVDTLGDFVAALNRMLRELGFGPITRAEVEPLVGKGSEHLIAEVIKLKAATAVKSHTLGPGYVQMAANTAYQKHYRAVNGQHSTVYPGAMEGVQALHAQGVKLACLTNKPLQPARDLLATKSVLSYFSHVFGGDSFERKKPDPLPVLRTCEALGVQPSDAWLIGDSQNDGQAGKAAGCSVALVRYGYNHGQPIETAPHDLLLQRLDEFLPQASALLRT